MLWSPAHVIPCARDRNARAVGQSDRVSRSRVAQRQIAQRQIAHPRVAQRVAQPRIAHPRVAGRRRPSSPPKGRAIADDDTGHPLPAATMRFPRACPALRMRRALPGPPDASRAARPFQMRRALPGPPGCVARCPALPGASRAARPSRVRRAHAAPNRAHGPLGRARYFVRDRL
jgi:hypothetical protein